MLEHRELTKLVTTFLEPYADRAIGAELVATGTPTLSTAPAGGSDAVNTVCAERAPSGGNCCQGFMGGKSYHDMKWARMAALCPRPWLSLEEDGDAQFASVHRSLSGMVRA